MKPTVVCLLVIGIGLLIAACAERSAAPQMKTVQGVDIERYAGKWYEIARMPNWFQRSCASGTTADYTLLEDGRIRVVNRCLKADGTESKVEGVAKVVPDSGGGKLKVQFFWPFWADYWILDLDQENYEWAIVGHPTRKFLWILARTPEIPESLYDELVQKTIRQGYPKDALSQ